MIEDPVSVIALALALGVAGQWIAARIGLPSIVLMLGAGLLAGPVLGVIDPEATFGDLLTPIISLGVGLLLFEGGLSLKVRQIGSTTRRVVVRLLTFGVLISLVLATGAALIATDLPRGVAVLFGSIMVVTGPTVVIPLLRQARLRPRVAGILRWEGIIVDPVGAVLGVSVLEVLLLEDGTVGQAALALLRTTVIGCTVGALVAVAVVVVFDRHWIPDNLRGPLSLVAAVGAFAAANELGEEAGLYAVTVAGVALANQRRVRIAPILELHEVLASLILAGIFVMLAARVEADTLSGNVLPALLLLVLLIVVVRPISVAVATIGTSLTRRERGYLACMAPRGIVAASVSSVFGASLTEHGVAGGEDLAAITFLVVCGTVLVYGPLARPLARRLRVDVPDPTGVALIGSRRWARALGMALSDAGVPVLVVAAAEEQAEESRQAGLLVYSGRLEGDGLPEALEGVGAKVAVVGSGADALDAVGIDHVVRHLGRANVWRIARDDDHQEELLKGEAVEGRHAFPDFTQESMDQALEAGGSVTVLPTGLAPTATELPMMVIDAKGEPSIPTGPIEPAPTDRVVVLALGSPGSIL